MSLVAGPGIAPGLEDYEPSVRLYTTPHIKENRNIISSQLSPLPLKPRIEISDGVIHVKISLTRLGSSMVEQGLHKTTVAGPNPAPATMAKETSEIIPGRMSSDEIISIFIAQAFQTVQLLSESVNKFRKSFNSRSQTITPSTAASTVPS